MTKKFIRRDSNRYSRLGKRRKKLQKWRRPTGRDNKMREKRRGYPARVSIGYKKGEKIEPILIYNSEDLNKLKLKKEEVILLGRVGKKKKIGIAKKANELKIKFSNFNATKFLKQIKKEEEKKKPTQEKKPEKKEDKKKEKKPEKEKPKEEKK